VAKSDRSGSNITTPPSRDIDPAVVVQGYIDAINAHDYQTAWSLGGRNLRPSTFDAFVAGFADTRHDTLTVLGVHGGTVQVRLIAEHTDGRRTRFEGYYLVEQGRIVDASLHPA